MQNQIANAIVEKAHTDKERAVEIVEQILISEVKARIGELSGAIADVYVQNFTAAEMRQMAAFFRSPVGNKYTEKLPLLFQESRQIGADWGRRVGQDAIRKNAQKLRDLGTNL